MKRLLLGAVLVSALSIVPSTLNAQNGQDREHDQQTHKTYYDAAHKDHHEWNANEDAAWGRYRDEHHIKQSDFAKANKRQQQDYWNWRHEHPDEH